MVSDSEPKFDDPSLCVPDEKFDERERPRSETIESEPIITRKMVDDGLEQGIIKPAFVNDDLTCRIGEYWFWFGGDRFDGMDLKDVPVSDLASEIADTLDAFREDWNIYSNEYEYYFHYLNENLVHDAEVSKDPADLTKAASRSASLDADVNSKKGVKL